MVKNNIKSGMYHGKLTEAKKTKNQQMWMQGEL